LPTTSDTFDQDHQRLSRETGEVKRMLSTLITKVRAADNKLMSEGR
jgi:hypothetical protein